ncbi:CAP domain-containing protein [Muricauda sp. JGD-17]|uniref:CAP domain-containing protein n=1 Tax=Flagellimonas ochracea TaxID=2696472 RepID=A0A964TBJ7_9FLAO|nr:CAP domain-containing protein [Allomuricauda ochracea]NAY91845.1 CAP domain-containing protein [Allomuricauda ochracea]
MKRLIGAVFVIAMMMGLSMCSTSSAEQEEQELIEALSENEKETIEPTEMEGTLLDLVNAYRNSVGVDALEKSPSAYKYAQEHNEYMISKNSLSHDNFEERASKIAEETNAKSVSENVARFYTTAEQALEGWLNSASHRAALEGNYTHTTLSVQLDKAGRPYFTQIFLTIE